MFLVPAPRPKTKELSWIPPDVHCAGLDMYAEANRRYFNIRFIHHPLKIAQNVAQAKRNAIHALKTNRNIVIKPADKGGAIHIVFTFDNKFFIQTNGTAKFAPQYANIFMHKFEQDIFAVQLLRPVLYTGYIDGIFFLWTQ
eukprot:g28553.t1